MCLKSLFPCCFKKKNKLKDILEKEDDEKILN